MTEHADSCVTDNLTIFIKRVESVSQTGNAQTNNQKRYIQEEDKGTEYNLLHMYVCVCVCMYVCMYICIYIYVYVCMYVYIYVCMCMSVYMYVCMLRGSSSIRTVGLQLLSTFACIHVVHVRTYTHINVANYQQTWRHVSEDLNLWRCCIWIFLRKFWKECISHTESKRFRFGPIDIFTSFPLPISVGNVVCSKYARIIHIRNTKYENKSRMCSVARPDVESLGLAERL
jgi:hypothetical protein